MDEVRVEVVAQRDAGNRGARFGALLNDSSFEGFGVGTALWLHERPPKKARNGVHLNLSAHHVLPFQGGLDDFAGRIQWSVVRPALSAPTVPRDQPARSSPSVVEQWKRSSMVSGPVTRPTWFPVRIRPPW